MVWISISNEIPILAIIIESIVAMSMIILTVRTIQKYFQRRRKPTLYLSLSFLFLSLGVGSSALGKWIHFYLNTPALSFDDGFILIAYQLTAIANVFLFAFLDEVFLNLGSIVVALSGIANGATVGLLILINNFQEEAYANAQSVVIYHAALSLVTFGLLAFFAFREASKSAQSMPKVGFVLIGFYGVFVALVFILFAADLIMPTGYTPFYYAAWISAGVGVLCGYLGYIFPDWLKKFLKLGGKEA